MKRLFALFAAGTLLSFVVGAGVALLLTGHFQAPKAGSGSDNIGRTFTASTRVSIGKDLSTTLVATNTARTYLEIANISGATTSQRSDIYCAVNGNAAVMYSGFTLPASTTKVLNLDNLYSGALNCKADGTTSTVTVLER